MEHRVLGKGLSALIPDKFEMVERKKIPDNVAYIKTTLIRDNAQQPRTNYDGDKLQDLVNSIKEKGFLQPVVIREIDNGYEIIAGERRLRAARILELEEVPAVIKNVSSEEALVLALIENIQREDLNPIEEAKAFRRLIEQFNMTQEDVAQSVGKDRSTISNLIRLLKLPTEIQDSLFTGDLSMGHARALLGLEDGEQQRRIFQRVKQKGLSVREVENLIKKQGVEPHRKSEKARHHEIVLLEEELQKRLGTKVRILAKKKKGKIIIEYYSLDDFERILQLLQK
jgi:ParB family transcriptional regulator, chromosome partitioning protein